MAMPEMSGKDAYAHMKKINPGVKVIITSGFGQDDRVEDTLELGADFLMQKPYTLEKLAAAVAKVLTG